MISKMFRITLTIAVASLAIGSAAGASAESRLRPCSNDVTGEICTKWNERESTWRKAGHAHPEVQARADRDDAATD
jgi:hypothetical protein